MANSGSDKFDHSDHPTSQAVPGDNAAPQRQPPDESPDPQPTEGARPPDQK